MGASPRVAMAKRTLGLGPDASLEACKKAMRQIVFQTHPDLHPNDPVATERCKRAIEAYSVVTGKQLEPEPPPPPPASPWSPYVPESYGLARYHPYAAPPAPRSRALVPSREYLRDQADLEDAYGGLGYWKRDGMLHVSLVELLQWVEEG